MNLRCKVKECRRLKAEQEKLPQTPGWWDGEVTALYHRWRNFLDVLRRQKTEMCFNTHTVGDSAVHTTHTEH